MRSRYSIAVLLTAASVLTGTATAADAAIDHVVALWRMNESSGARTMVDSSGNGLRGSIGREVQTGVRVNGATGYRFERLDPDTPPTHRGHVITVPDTDELDPGERDFAVTVRLRTTHKFGNIIQKGQATVSGGNFKMQIPNGIVQCMYRGSKGTILLSSTRRLNDGYWHTVTCERTSSAQRLIVDGSTLAKRSGWTGRIANSWPVSIGGKTACDQVEVGCDYYAGDLDWVEIDAD